MHLQTEEKRSVEQKDPSCRRPLKIVTVIVFEIETDKDRTLLNEGINSRDIQTNVVIQLDNDVMKVTTASLLGEKKTIVTPYNQ